MSAFPVHKAAKSSIAPAVGLFFLAPLVAEFLLGNLPIKLLPALILLAPLYGGGALLIRETVRRTNRGWPSIFLLGLAYAILEEAFTTQTLFNPDYLLMKMHLLDSAYIPALGMGGWWTMLMLNLHTVWSISTPIALVEAAVPSRAGKPWLGKTGYFMTVLVFLFGAVANTLFSYRHDHFVASPAQFAGAAVICILLMAAAFLLPRWDKAEGRGRVPNPWIIGALALAAGSAVLTIPKAWGWGAFAALLILDFCALAAILFWGRQVSWNRRHKQALAAGAALAYAWHAFLQHPVVGGSMAGVRIGNVVFALGALWLIQLSGKRASAFVKAQEIGDTNKTVAL